MFGTDFIISIFAGLMSRWTKSLECSSFKPAARIKEMNDGFSGECILVPDILYILPSDGSHKHNKSNKTGATSGTGTVTLCKHLISTPSILSGLVLYNFRFSLCSFDDYCYHFPFGHCIVCPFS